MTEKQRQPNKPGGELRDGGDRPADELRAVRNQSSVSPDDYPEGSDGKPESPKD